MGTGKGIAQYSLDTIFTPRYITQHAAVDVEVTDEFESWWEGLSEPEREAVAGHVGALEEHGLSLEFPRTSKIKGSRHGRMRELRVKCQGKQLRVLYAFDPRRVAILLIGGDKTGNDRWYEEFVPKADAIYDTYLEVLKLEGLLPKD